VLIPYIKYILTAETLFRVHSPFAYNFLNIITKDRRIPEFDAIEGLRSQMLQEKRIINFIDYGARQGIYSIPLKSVASRSLKKPKYSRLLYRIVKYLSPESIIEFGTSLGISTCYMYLASETKTLTTVEGCSEIAEIAAKNFKTKGCDKIHLINKTFDEAIQQDFGNPQAVDLVFIDGNHTKEATIRYFEYFVSKHHNNSVFMFDDIHWSKGMEEAWLYIRSHQSVTTTIDLFQLGIVFFKKELSKQNFIIRY